MKLWIRNQNRETLELITYLQIIYLDELDQENKWVIEGGSYLGYYKTKERALEVLDDIQNKIKTLLYLKPKSLLGINEIKAGKKYFEKINGIDFITCDNNFEIEPITTNVIVYEMPEE